MDRPLVVPARAISLEVLPDPFNPPACRLQRSEQRLKILIGMLRPSHGAPLCGPLRTSTTLPGHTTGVNGSITTCTPPWIWTAYGAASCAAPPSYLTDLVGVELLDRLAEQ